MALPAPLSAKNEKYDTIRCIRL